jgi:serine/threonine protein phosphatase PrpC
LPDYRIIKKSKNDKYILMGSDGLFDTLTNDSIYDIIQTNENETLENICSILIDKAYSNGSYDNITAILIKFI